MIGLTNYSLKVSFSTVIILILLLFKNSVESSDLNLGSFGETVPVSSIDLPTSILPGKWQKVKGLRIDNLASIDGAESQTPTVKALAKQLQPLGIKSVGDFSLTNVDFPLNTVAVKVFVFGSAEQCQRWWQKNISMMDGNNITKQWSTMVSLG